MKIDKQNGNVYYNDEKHIYWSGNRKYISATTLIGKYEQEFDKEFWSGYKAIERLLDKLDFKVAKRLLLNKMSITDEDVIGFNLDLILYHKTKLMILDEWAEKNKKSLERGTRIHKEFEEMTMNKPSKVLNKFKIGGVLEYNQDWDLFTCENGVFPEYLLYNHEYEIAGQSDLVVKKGNKVTITDFKTNEKIDLESGYNVRTRSKAMMQYPLNNIMDCNFYHYTLQLSLYGWMVEQIDPSLEIDGLHILHIDHSDNETLYDVEYRPQDIERMLKHYSKTKRTEERRKNRERIQY